MRCGLVRCTPAPDACLALELQNQKALSPIVQADQKASSDPVCMCIFVTHTALCADERCVLMSTVC